MKPSSGINSFTTISPGLLCNAARRFGTPFYLYDEAFIIDRCSKLRSMPHAHGLRVRYAMKANPCKAILRLVHGQGVSIDASSLNEVRRAHMAGIPYSDIILTTQEVPEGDDRCALEEMMRNGLLYNVCSVRQLELIADFAGKHDIGLSLRVHPGVGAGESASRNTGDHYSCFGVHLSDIERVSDYAKKKKIQFRQLHTHIGSGGDPEVWKANIDLELSILNTHFPDADSISFGGGMKEARMPDERSANMQELGEYAALRIESFYRETGRKLQVEVEPGTYLLANAGYAVTKVVDKKRTGADGYNFLITNGGMEINTRPLMYGSQHPFYVISKDGRLLSSEFRADGWETHGYSAVVMGRCCESGDSQCIDMEGVNSPRPMAEPAIGDYLVIGGTGAYCSAMSPFNYNSHVQIVEVLAGQDGELRLIRRKQTLEQVVENEI